MTECETLSLRSQGLLMHATPRQFTPCWLNLQQIIGNYFTIRFFVLFIYHAYRIPWLEEDVVAFLRRQSELLMQRIIQIAEHLIYRRVGSTVFSLLRYIGHNIFYPWISYHLFCVKHRFLNRKTMATTIEPSVNNVTYQLMDTEYNDSSYYGDAYYGGSNWPASKICVLFIYILIMLFGFVGNSLVIFAICKRGRQNVTSLLLCSLAFSDLVMVLIFMPFKTLDMFRYGDWPYGAFMCKIISYISLVTPSCSGCMLMVISLER